MDTFPKEVLAILTYGSSIDATNHAYSDTDICVVAPSIDKTAKEKLWRSLSIDPHVDVKFFEDLPVILKHEVILRHRVMYVQDELKLLEYFLFWQKVYERFFPYYKKAKKTLQERLTQWKSKKK